MPAKSATKFVMVAALACFFAACQPSGQPTARTSPEVKQFADPAVQGLYDQAKLGAPEAQYQFGMAHCCDLKGDKSFIEGLKWFCPAARQGHTGAQKQIAAIYLVENPYRLFPQAIYQPGIADSDVLSYAWLLVATERGKDMEAEKALLDLGHKLKVHDQSEGSKLAAKFPDLPCEIPEGRAEELKNLEIAPPVPAPDAGATSS